MNDGMDTYLSEIHGQSWEFYQISTLVLCILYRVVAASSTTRSANAYCIMTSDQIGTFLLGYVKSVSNNIHMY